MKYSGWNLEKTLLIRSDYPRARKDEFFDVYLAVETRDAQNLANDVRVVLKPAWNRLGAEAPCQVYNIENHGAVTTLRVAFRADLPANCTQRVGILYDNPQASKPIYESDFEISGSGLEYLVQNRHYRIRTCPGSGQLSDISMKNSILEYVHTKLLSPEKFVQKGAQVIFAVEKDGDIRPAPASAADWVSPELISVERGPLFFALKRRGRLAPPGLAEEKCPRLEIAYKFFPDRPYFLISSRLEFQSDTPVFGIRNEMLAMGNAHFGYYCFRPVTPGLPDTDVEEAGHILVDEEHTRDLPPGIIFSDFLPHDLAWHAFINTVRRKDFRFDYAVTGIRLDASTASREAPAYRQAIYLEKGANTISWFRAPVHVKKLCRENIVMIPKDTVYREAHAVHFAEWDEKKAWLNGVDELGRRLNNPPAISMHPHFLGGSHPPEKIELLPAGSFKNSYTKAGVR